jgi:hypothetical protein
MWHSFYEELKTWQTGIGALLGFVALMVAALWNFHLNRRRDASIRKEEALSVAAALYGEIVLFRKQIAGLGRAVAASQLRREVELNIHFVQSHTLPEPLLYKALASKVGLLNSDLVVAITEFYGNVQEAKTWLPLLVENKERGYQFSTLAVLMPARDAVRNIVPALRKIEHMASIGTQCPDPDLGMTDEAIEDEERIFRDA